MSSQDPDKELSKGDTRNMGFDHLDDVQRREELERILVQSQVIVFLWRAEEGWPVEFVSENITQIGYTPHEFYSGQVSYSDIVFPEDGARVAEEVSRYSQEEGRKSFDQEYRILTRQGKVCWIDDRTLIRRDGNGRITHYQGIILDRTKRKEAEIKLAEQYDFLQVLINTIPLPIFYSNTAGLYQGCNRAFEEMLDRKHEDIVGKSVFDLAPGELAKVYREKDQALFDHPGVQVYEGEVVYADGQKHNVIFNKATFNRQDGSTDGLVGAMLDITRRKKAEEKLAIYTKELQFRNARLEDDLKMTREIQQILLPQEYPSMPVSCPPDESALKFAHLYLPCEAVGGDFFEVLTISENQAGIFLCDVMGHGIRAALISAILRGLIMESISVAHHPGTFLRELNRSYMTIFRHTDHDIFASAVYLVADISTGQMLYANAGHPSPFCIRRSSGAVEPLQSDGKTRGPALGLIPDAEYPEAVHALAPGDLIMLYTDGLVEMENNQGEPFGEEGVVRAISRRLRHSMPDLFNGIMDDLEAFAGNNRFEDDICLVGMDVSWLGKPPVET